MIAYSGAVKVLDFGIAKAADAVAVTRTGLVKGKYAYMAPEQLLAERLDHRADIYSTGIVIYELLSGQRPYTAPSEAALVRRILDTPLPPLGEKAPHLPADLIAIVTKALEKDREKRYPTAEAFANDLEGWIGTQPADSNLLLPAYMRNHFSTKSGEFPAIVTPSSAQVAAVRLPPPASTPGPVPDGPVSVASSEFSLVLPPEPPTRPEHDKPPARGVLALAIGLTVAVAMVVVAAAVVISRERHLKLRALGDDPVQLAPDASVAEAPDASALAVAQLPDAGRPEEVEAPDASVAATNLPSVPRDAGPAHATPHRPEPPRVRHDPRPKPVTGNGKVDLRVNPWGEVAEGATSYGMTPFAPLELSPGHHTFTITNEKLQVTRTVHVNVVSGKTITVRVDMLE
jgi:serine/threonine-protein kinase